MSSSEYPGDKFCKEELILRDFLATDRIILANEETLPLYIRTALSVFVLGAFFLQFFHSFLGK